MDNHIDRPVLGRNGYFFVALRAFFFGAAFADSRGAGGVFKNRLAMSSIVSGFGCCTLFMVEFHHG